MKASVSTATDETIDAVTSWWHDDALRELVVDRPAKVLIIILLAVGAQWALKRLINKFSRQALSKPGGTLPRIPFSPMPGAAAARKPQSEDAEQTAQMAALDRAKENRRRSRIKTLAGVGHSCVSIVVWTLAVLTILQTVGINIAPLIASAGVVGVALGFGAQSLVKDFLSGVFMLLEDQYGIGDVVNLEEGITGEVQDITLRVTKVRDIDGTLWIMRNGEILRVGNFSDQFSICRIQVPVGLSNNATDAWHVIDRAVHDAIKDEEIRGDVLAEPVLDGISEWETDHISYRISIKTMPGQQWHVQRHAQVHILNAMQEAGVQVPYPHGIGVAKLTQAKEES